MRILRRWRLQGVGNDTVFLIKQEPGYTGPLDTHAVTIRAFPLP